MKSLQSLTLKQNPSDNKQEQEEQTYQNLSITVDGKIPNVLKIRLDVYWKPTITHLNLIYPAFLAIANAFSLDRT
jgi:hypothetical protein